MPPLSPLRVEKTEPLSLAAPPLAQGSRPPSLVHSRSNCIRYPRSFYQNRTHRPSLRHCRPPSPPPLGRLRPIPDLANARKSSHHATCCISLAASCRLLRLVGLVRGLASPTTGTSCRATVGTSINTTIPLLCLRSTILSVSLTVTVGRHCRTRQVGRRSESECGKARKAPSIKTAP